MRERRECFIRGSKNLCWTVETGRAEWPAAGLYWVTIKMGQPLLALIMSGPGLENVGIVKNCPELHLSHPNCWSSSVNSSPSS